MSANAVTASRPDLLVQFHSCIIAMLGGNPAGVEADASAALVFVGEASANALRDLRGRLPPHTILLYLYPAGTAGGEEPDMLAAIASGDRTCICAMTSESRFVEKAGLLVGMLPGKSVRVMRAPALAETCAEEWESILKTVKSAQENNSQNSTRGLIRMRCSVNNLPRVWEKSGIELVKAPADVPAVICGAGPSLAVQMQLLKSIASKVVLVAVGHAVPALLKNGIVPHVVVESDSMARRNWPDEFKIDSLLVATPDVSPSLAVRFENVLWNYGSFNPFNVAMKRWGVGLLSLALGRTVSITALDLAVRMGCTEVAFVGQDMSIADGGDSHVDGSKTDPCDKLFPVKATDGGTAYATEDLLGLKADVEDFIKHLAGIGMVRVLNCTARGAKIEGTVSVGFADFCAGVQSHPDVAPVWKRGTGKAQWQGNIKSLLDDIAQYEGLADKIVAACRQLEKGLLNPAVGEEKLRAGQARLQELMLREEVARARDISSEWLNTVMHYTDGIMRQIPGLVTDTADPFAQLKFLCERFKFAGSICTDISTDLDMAVRSIRRMEKGKGDDLEKDVGIDLVEAPFIFKAFRNLVVRQLRDANPELAAFLERHKPDPGERFRIKWMNQVIPYVEVKEESGGWRPVSSFLSMYSDAVQDVERFVAETGFDPLRNGLVVLAPGNWVHSCALARVLPDVEVMMVDPWLDLFSAMIERGCFAHVLPAGALVVAADARTPGWRSLYSARVAAWREKGRIPQMFVPPGCRGLPEVAKLQEDLRSL